LRIVRVEGERAVLNDEVTPGTGAARIRFEHRPPFLEDAN
jgi:hypothetical protein